MIRLEKTTKISKRVAKRSAKMTAVMVEPGVFDVTPDTPDKVVRRVQFHVYDDGEITMDCFEKESLLSCLGNAHGKFCSHCNAAINLLLQENGLASEGERTT